MADEPDRIEFVRTGGFANIAMRATVPADALGPQERAGLDKLLSRDPIEEAAAGEPDRFQYDIAVVSGQRRQHVRLGERDIDEHLRPLIDHLEHHAAPATRRPE
jgi:hypothetical protein